MMLRVEFRASSTRSSDRRAVNLRSCVLLLPYKPAVFSSMYSRILARTTGGSPGAANMRLMVVAERPDALWFALSMVQVVLRESPSALTCLSSVSNPAATRASPSSLILDDCRAFISATMGVRPCWSESSRRLSTGTVGDAGKLSDSMSFTLIGPSTSPPSALAYLDYAAIVNCR